MTYRPTALGCLFLLLAIVLAVCEVVGVWEFVREQPSGLYVLAGNCFVAGIAPALPALADGAWRNHRKIWTLVAWIGFAVCLAIVMTAAIARTGQATDSAQQMRQSAERAKLIAEKTEADALDTYRSAQTAALRECDVRGKRCLEAEDKAEAARRGLAAARAMLVTAPGAQVDPLARRLSAVLRLPEEQIRLLQPLLLPLALSILSALFFAGWSRLDFVEADTGTPTTPMQPTEAPQTLAQAVPALTLSPPARVARTPLPAKFGAVASFLVSSTEPAPDEAIEIERSLYNAYVAWCGAGCVQALNKGQFALELAKIGKAAGLTIEIRGREAFCLDRRLAA